MHFKIFFVFITAFSVFSIALGQDQPQTGFSLVQEIGQVSPQGVRYDPNFDRLVMVDTQGQLVLADALTLVVQHVLYTSGELFGYQFSHNGQWLAVAQGNTVDVWNTQTGERDLELQPTVALGFESRLEFSDDDSLLLFRAIVPAPDDIRRSETDTTLAPWLWDLEAERRNRTGILPEQRRAQPFFDLRTDLLLTPNNKLIAALPRSIAIYGFENGSYDVLTNLETNRFEFDPLDVWYSMRGDQAYYRSTDGSAYFQIDTLTGAASQLPIGQELLYSQIATQGNLALNATTQIIGEGNTLQSNSFLRLLLTDHYHPNESAVTVMLLDILEPITMGDEQTAFLIYMLNENTGRGVIDLVRPDDVTHIALNPAHNQVAVRRMTAGNPVEIYDLPTGTLVTSFAPRYPTVSQNNLFTFDDSGDALLVGWSRYDVHSGEAISEAPRYHPGFESFMFAEDDSSVITVNGHELWVWDLDTGQPIQRETIQLNGELVASSADGQRYLTRLPFMGEIINEGEEQTTEGEAETEQPGELFDGDGEDPDVVALLQSVDIPAVQIPPGQGVEHYNVATGQRRQIIFDQLPDRQIQQVIASPDWEYMMVVYNSNPFSPYYPGNEVGIYSFDAGLLWFYAGDDLPAPRARRYGWSSNQTAFVLSGSNSAYSQPQRIYGLDYHPSGLPACLVEAFPETWTQWRDLWEQLQAELRYDQLGRLTQRICESSLESVAMVDTIFFPSPTPTRPPIQPTSSRIAGLPACLSSYLPGQAADYAPQWRALTEGLDDTQVAEVEEILCLGLADGVSVPVPDIAYPSNPRLQVVSIDAETGERAISAFVSLAVSEPRPLEPVLADFQAQFGFLPIDAQMSNNGELLAVRTPANHVRVYRLPRPYQTYIDALQATLDASEAERPVVVSLLATPTLPAIPLGGPRPTLTPTITPTAPPRPQATFDYAERDQVVEFCDHMEIYSVLDPPPGYAPTGRLLTIENNEDVITVYDPVNGRTRLGEDLVDAEFGQLSPNANWLLVQDAQIVVSRADGTDPVVLYETFEQSVFPSQISWVDNDSLLISFEGYLPEISPDRVTLYQQYDADTGEFLPPATATPSRNINNLPANVYSRQPLGGPMVVLSVSFNAGYHPGWRYYLYNTETDELNYFARVTDPNQLSLIWRPDGKIMYYSYPDSDAWFAYDYAEDRHWIIGDLPIGDWSRDGRYRLTWGLPDAGEVNERLANDQPIPNLSIWDSDTGLTRRYCVPGTSEMQFSAQFFWSPDSRYLAFLATLPGDVVDDIPRQRTLILDTETGSIAELSRDVNRIILWTM